MAPPLRSTLAVLAGYLVYVAVIATGGWLCSHLLNAHADIPTARYFTSSLVYYLLAALLGGYVAATLGRHAPVAHGIALAILIFALNVINLITKFDSVHRTYVLLINIGGPLMAIAGAFLRRSHTDPLPPAPQRVQEL